MIYWTEVGGNPWVRAIAIIVTGALYYFYREDAPVDIELWAEPYGRCSEDDPFHQFP